MTTSTRTVLGRCVLGSSCRATLDGLVRTGDRFDVWRECWRGRGGYRQETVLAHRGCNDRADHRKDGQ